MQEVPIDASDLAGYVGCLFDQYLAHPEILRLSAWDILYEFEKWIFQLIEVGFGRNIPRLSNYTNCGINNSAHDVQ
jgi:hypothetical protein